MRTAKGSRLIRAIDEIESLELHWSHWLITFLLLVIARNLLEGALGPGRVLGFTYFASPSALMVIDHFLFFYVSLFLGISVLLALLARQPVSRVMKITTPAWALVLLPPIIDFLLTKGQGARISYIIDPQSAVLRFFNPGASLDGVSVGQRLEILGACLLGTLYVRVKTRSWARSAAAFIGLYLLIAAHGALPGLVARAWHAITEGTSVAGAAAYNVFFKSGGLVQEESRKLALVFLFSSCLLGWLAWRMHAPGKEEAMRKNIRPLRSLHYLAMTAIGIGMGAALFSTGQPGITACGGDVLGIVAACLAVFLAVQASISLNDIHDQRADRISDARRPLVSGILHRTDASIEASVLAAASLLLALNIKYQTFLVIALCLAVSVFYSAPPLRLKRYPGIATTVLGLASLGAALAGFSLFAEEMTFALFPPRLGWLFVLSFGAAFTAKDLKDTDGDKATGVLTIPVILGPKIGRAVVAGLVFAAYALVPVFLPYPTLVVPAIALGILGFAIAWLWKRPRVDQLLLAIYLAFALAAGIVVMRDVGPLLGTPERPLIDAKRSQSLGRRSESLGDWDEASRHYAHALEHLRDDPTLLEHAGVAHFRSGRLGEASEALTHAAALVPSSPVVFEYLAITRARLGDTDAALGLLHAAVSRRIRPGLFRAHLGEIYFESGQHDRAARELAAALRMGRPDLPTRIRLGDALLSLGDYSQARRQYEAVAAKHAASSDAHAALGAFHHASGDLGLALDELGRAVDLDPRDARLWNNLAVVYRDLGRHEEALKALERATDISPTLVDAYYNRGRIFEALGDESGARRQYLLALELKPDFDPAREALGRLGTQ